MIMTNIKMWLPRSCRLRRRVWMDMIVAGLLTWTHYGDPLTHAQSWNGWKSKPPWSAVAISRASTVILLRHQCPTAQESKLSVVKR